MSPIYPMLFTLLQEFLYGADVALTPHMELVLTELATFGCILVVAVPFVLCWIVIKGFMEVLGF